METLKIVIGCNGNLGNAISKFELKNNKKVIGIDINQNSLLESSSNFKYLKFDCTFPKEIDNYFATIAPKDNIFVRSLVLAAALDSVPEEANNKSLYNYGLSNQEFDEIQKRINVNITSQIFMLKVFEKYLFKNSHVCLFSSIYGINSPDHRIYQKGFIKPIEYTASKSAIIGLTKHFAVTSANSEKGRCNCLILGGVESEVQTDDFKNKYIDRVPLKKMAQLNDVVNAYSFLDSDKAKYITGTSLTVDGGYSSW